MKILHVITSLEIGGAEHLLVDLLPKLNHDDCTVDLCVLNGVRTPFFDELEKKGIKIIVLSMSHNVRNPFLIPSLGRLMRNYDIVHAHNTSSQYFVAMAAKVLCSVELVTTEHTTSNRRRDWRWYPHFLERWMYNQYNKVICISHQAETNLREYLGACKADISTIFNGVDVEKFQKAKPNPAMRHSSGGFVVVMVAGFRYQKDQDTLIRAFGHIDKEKYELWLVGDGDRRADLEALTEKLNLKNNVKFWGLRTDIPELLHTADAIVMSSHFEGLSLSNIEGMSVGKPFIASDVDGLRELTQGAGLLFPHGDDKALAELIERLHEDTAYAKEIAEKCIKRAKQYDISVMAEKYSRVYQSLLHK